MKNWDTLTPDVTRLMNRHYTPGRAGRPPYWGLFYTQKQEDNIRAYLMKLSFLSNRAACCGIYLIKTADS